MSDAITHASRQSFLLDKDWRLLQIFNGYRACLALTLLMIYGMNSGLVLLDITKLKIYFYLTLGYLIFSVICLIISRDRYFRFEWQVRFQVAVDILLLAALWHLEPRFWGSFGVLINLAIIAGSILMSGRSVFFFASIACCTILLESLLTVRVATFELADLAHALLLSMSFFATALLAHLLSKRLRASEIIMQKQALDLLKWQQLNEDIIQRLQSGVVVVDTAGKVLLINCAASKLLACKQQTGMKLEIISALLASQWHHHLAGTPTSMQTEALDFSSQFVTLDNEYGGGTLILIDDPVRTAKQAQQMKLASLGRFTASIAHELRNPLGAISHAVQLLAESHALQEEESRLAQIIRQQADRMNAVIKNILQLSRRREADLVAINLQEWLTSFASQFHTAALPQAKVAVLTSNEQVKVTIDPSQMYQVLANLCENAVRYSPSATAYLQMQLDPISQAIKVDVLDDGPGVTPEQHKRLFEPFFTTDQQGTGLGLYLAKELCEANFASLSYHSRSSGGSCFRIHFHHSKEQLA